jgi:hypothetical protein
LSRRRWTEDELDFIEENGAVLGLANLSLRLGRSVNAVKLKMNRSGIRLLETGYTCTCLARELGRARLTLWKWRSKGWIKGRIAEWKTRYGTHPVIFMEDEIVRFLKRFAHLFNPRAVPNRYFANVIAEAQRG